LKLVGRDDGDEWCYGQTDRGLDYQPSSSFAARRFSFRWPGRL